MDMIRTQQLEPRTSFPFERNLKELFGIGRPALREALITLEHMGFIPSKNRRDMSPLPTSFELLPNRHQASIAPGGRRVDRRRNLLQKPMNVICIRIPRDFVR
jgi:DNA-binding transcriptional MocR family regulator